MEERFKVLANEGLSYVELERFKKDRDKLETVRPPERVDFFSGWRIEEEKSLKAELETTATVLVNAAIRDGGGGTFSSMDQSEPVLISLGKYFLNGLAKYSLPVIKLAYLPFLEKKLNAVLNGNLVNEWNSRFLGVDELTAIVKQRIPKSFEPSMINKDPRFPVERCGQSSDGKWFDRWLGEALGDKKLIFFEPHDRYVERLKEFYLKVYQPMLEEEARAREMELKKVEAPPPQPEPAPPPVNDPAAVSEVQLMEFYEEATPPRNTSLFAERLRNKFRGGGN